MCICRCLCVCVWGEGVSVSENNVDFLILPPLPPERGDYRCVLPPLVYALIGITSSPCVRYAGSPPERPLQPWDCFLNGTEFNFT